MKPLQIGLALLFLAHLQPLLASEAGGRLGRVSRETERGTRAEQTDLAGPGWVRTDATPAVVYLANGRIVKLGEHAAAYLREVAPGEIEVRVAAGELLVTGADGRVMSAGRNSHFVLAALAPGAANVVPERRTAAAEGDEDGPRAVIPAAAGD